LKSAAGDMRTAIEFWKLTPQSLDILVPGLEQKAKVFIAVCNAHLENLENIQQLMNACCCRVSRFFSTSDIVLELANILQRLARTTIRRRDARLALAPAATSATLTSGSSPDYNMQVGAFFRQHFP
jgi:hypothetical protein